MNNPVQTFPESQRFYIYIRKWVRPISVHFLVYGRIRVKYEYGRIRVKNLCEKIQH